MGFALPVPTMSGAEPWTGSNIDMPFGLRLAVGAKPIPPDTAPPIRVSYPVVKASTTPCGRWPEDMLETTDNKHYANFGCSFQNNLAAQVANPNDFLGPRKQGEIDAENRMGVIDKYRGAESIYKPGQVSEDFRAAREIAY